MMEKIRELLERGLSKERHKAKPDAMDQVSVARWWRSWAMDLETNARGALEVLSSPHPEAREEDKPVDFVALIRQMAERIGQPHDVAISIVLNESEVMAMYAALSRLAAPKPEGQALTFEQVGWLRMVLGRALYRVEHFPGQSNDEGIEADELAKAIILLGGEPAAPEPIPPESLDQLVRDVDAVRHPERESAPAAPSEELVANALTAADRMELIPYFVKTSSLVHLARAYRALRSQLARKDEGIKVRDELLDEIDRGLWDNGLLSTLKEIRNRRAALREPDGRKGECGE